MLLNSFYTYTVIEKSDDKISVAIKLNAEHQVYKGHFPEMPITPGVCQVQMIKEILSTEFNQVYKIISARDIKFLNMINPNDNDQLNLEVNISYNELGELKINGIMNNGEQKVLKIRALLNKA